MAGSSTTNDGLEGAGDPSPGISPAAEAEPGEGRTVSLFAAGMGDRCVTCGSPLASDQRYCVECGARRGKARYPVGGAAQPAEPPRAAQPPREPPRRRISFSGALVAGIATLLLAMGVGVEIGRLGNSGNSSSNQHASSPPVQVVTVGGGSGGAAAAAATTPTTAVTATRGSASHGKKTKVAPKITTKVVAVAQQAAAKQLGAAAPKQPTITNGQQCQSGQAGCQNGHFTGNFFGP